MKFELWTFIWAFVNFFIMLAILNKFLFKPMLGMLDERKKTIADGLEKAEAARQEAARIQAEYENKLDSARQESQQIVDRATKMGDQMREEILVNAKQEAEKTLNRARQQIAQETDAAVAVLRSEVANLAIVAAGKVIDKSLNADDHERMVKEFIDEVGDLKC